MTFDVRANKAFLSSSIHQMDDVYPTFCLSALSTLWIYCRGPPARFAAANSACCAVRHRVAVKV